MGLRQEKKAEQRRAILDAAITLFRKRGYEQTRVQDIIGRLRISEATFFNYFPAKEALLHQIALDQLDFSIAALWTELERHDRSVPDRIRYVMNQWAQGWDADREFYVMVVPRSRMLSGDQGALREKSMRLYSLYEALFREGQRRGEIRTDTPPIQLAEMLEGICVLIAENWVFGWWKDRTEPLADRFRTAVNVFRDGCKPAKLGRSSRATKSKPKGAKLPVRRR
ncbi:MAG TPA: TetR/AcrR family transcriptional regulator [Candidatus Binataceae bacterium]|nr:TetR/AcrR family transcriptional regulator [Candidatus Binataceae bacterium]